MTIALWARIIKNQDLSTGPLASLSIRSFARTAHFAHSLARGSVNDWMAILSVFLDAPSHLYMRLCPSVRRSVRRSVRPLVRLSRVIFEVEKYEY